MDSECSGIQFPVEIVRSRKQLFHHHCKKSMGRRRICCCWRTRQQQLKQEKLISTPGPTN
ncbi:hypothetical protein DY958_23025 [Pseudomonas aeruginosa]|nr:hypothetical protein DY958_23025 [Pseudomonas aeruginosa]